MADISVDIGIYDEIVSFLPLFQHDDHENILRAVYNMVMQQRNSDNIIKAVERASKSLRDLRIAEISMLDMQIKDGKVEAYRAKVKVSFKFEG